MNGGKTAGEYRVRRRAYQSLWGQFRTCLRRRDRAYQRLWRQHVRGLRVRRRAYQRLRREHLRALMGTAPPIPPRTARRHTIPVLGRSLFELSSAHRCVNYYGSTCSNCGGWNTAGAAAAGAAVGLGVGAVAGAAIANANNTAAASNAYASGYTAGGSGDSGYAMGADLSGQCLPVAPHPTSAARPTTCAAIRGSSRPTARTEFTTAWCQARGVDRSLDNGLPLGGLRNDQGRRYLVTSGIRP